MNQRQSQPAKLHSEHAGMQRATDVTVPIASQQVDSEILDLHEEISSVRALWAHTQRRLDRERALRAADRADLTLERDAALAEIATMRNSKSWKLSAPVRVLNRIARRLLG